MLQEEQKGKGTREQTAAEKRTRPYSTLQCSSVLERNGQRPHKRLIAKLSGVWVRQGYRGAAEWGVGLGGATRSEEVDRGGHVPSAEGTPERTASHQEREFGLGKEERGWDNFSSRGHVTPA
ncbi:hypothetical protein FVEG_03569 [Fusarium verticillioides 7600]|uniref:Uncharacterized protein n=1 Tax=Gibberella moniliformis (strain M3125 / FGSC 7600) TaxID=334819 RepID=W7M1M8_GIBM7|nr:hypothetical protein FVEG_03569 [Fusarium verticillioides 7600]EWG41450.1 hypothetical protein FVEG_03569 [Fusarium verticillioides 7600]